MTYAWLNGEIVEATEPKLNLLTHALHYGTFVFEGLHTYKSENKVFVFRLQEHLDRFEKSAAAFGFELQYSPEAIIAAIKEVVARNNFGDAYIRPMLFYGSDSLLSVYPQKRDLQLAIVGAPTPPIELKPIAVKTVSIRRIPESATRYGTKVGGLYANSLMAMHEARTEGFDEALLLDTDGNVAEGPAQNVFIITNDTLITPSSRSILPGITRDTILTIARDIGLNSEISAITPDRVLDADEVFFSGTLAEIVPIGKVDGTVIGDGDTGSVTQKLHAMYADVVRGKNKSYTKWLYQV